MKKYFILQSLFFSMLPFVSQAQETAEAIETQSNYTLVIKANNMYQFSKKPLNNYYSLGGELGLYFNDKIYVGLAQYSSLAPSDIWKNNPYNPDKFQVYEYSINAAHKFDLKGPLYVLAGLRVGYSAMHMEYRFNNGVDSDETMTKEKLASVFISPDLNLGLKVHKYISIEAGLNYKYNFGDKKKWGLSTDHLNGLTGQISIIGNIPL